jgi:hypothetical protein
LIALSLEGGTIFRYFVGSYAKRKLVVTVPMILAVVAFPVVRVMAETMPEMDEMEHVTAVDEETGETYGWLPQPSRTGAQTYVWGRRSGGDGPPTSWTSSQPPPEFDRD